MVPVYVPATAPSGTATTSVGSHVTEQKGDRAGIVRRGELQRPFARDGAISRLPFCLGDWTSTRDLPAVASRTFQERWSARRDLSL